MLSWNGTSKTICALAAIAAYFALAEWSKATYVDFTPKGKTVIRLYRPFEKFGEATLAVIGHPLRISRTPPTTISALRF
jgi:hypothetical protein